MRKTVNTTGNGIFISVYTVPTDWQLCDNTDVASWEPQKIPFLSGHRGKYFWEWGIKSKALQYILHFEKAQKRFISVTALKQKQRWDRSRGFVGTSKSRAVQTRSGASRGRETCVWHGRCPSELGSLMSLLDIKSLTQESISQHYKACVPFWYTWQSYHSLQTLVSPTVV